MADEVALNLCREAESKSQHLALDVLSQPIIVFDGPDSAFLCHTDIQDLHNHKQIAPKAREFGTNDKIILSYSIKEFPEFAFVVVLGAADSFFYPPVDFHGFLGAEVVDFKSLILDSLLVAADSDVPVDHTCLCFLLFVVFIKLSIFVYCI